MKIKSSNFLKSASKKTGWPQTRLPEIAFTGRSNVGKSSLINFILGRKNLVKVSNTPGKTRLINFFNIGANPLDFLLVDLPGYGYAQGPVKEKEQWRVMIEEFLKNRKELLGIFLLIDSRRGIQEMDMNLLDWLVAYNLKACIIFTKTDKLKRSEQIKIVKNQTLEKIMSKWKGFSGPILSSVGNKIGKKNIFNQIETWLEID
jgi:GTP-binding protein